jgi:hypothetical protein
MGKGEETFRHANTERKEKDVKVMSQQPVLALRVKALRP